MKKYLSLLLAVLMILSMCVCVSAASAEDEKTFIITISAEPTFYNPDGVTDDNAYIVGQSIYSSLVALNANSEIIPDLAKSWGISDDGLVYTFHLNEGVKWHDGVDFTSTDVKFIYRS